MTKIPPRTKKYGNQRTTAVLVDKVRSAIAGAVAEQALLMLVGMLLPQFAFAIYAGIVVYTYGQKALSMKKEYDEMTGEPEDKLTTLALREGFRVGIAAIGEETVGRQVTELVSKSVHTTTQELSSKGVFARVATAMGQPDLSSLLRDFYASTTERVVLATYSGTQDDIVDYVAKREIN